MKAYDEGKNLSGVMTFDNFGLNQGQGQTCQIFTV